MPEIKIFPETHIAYVSEVGPYESSIPRGFKRLFDWLQANNVRPVGASMGIFYDDPAKVAPDNRRCDLCVPIAPDVTGSGEVRTKEIGGWQVAALIYQGEQNARAAYSDVYDWLHQQGYHELDAPIEIYLSRLGEELRAEIAVPVVEQQLMPGPQKGTKKAVFKGRARSGATAGTTKKTTRRSAKKKAGGEQG